MSVLNLESGNKNEIIRYDDGISLNGNANFDLKGSSYSDEVEITSYIGNIISSIESTLSNFNSLVLEANRYLNRNSDISNIPLPDFKELNFSISESGLYANNNMNAVVKTSGGNLNIRADSNSNTDILGKIPNGKSISVLEKGDKWTKISYTDENGKKIEGYVATKYIEEDNNKNTNIPNQTSIKNQDTSTNQTSNVILEYTVKTSGGNLNVRSGPSTKYSVQTTLAPDTKVKVLENVGNWSKIQIGDDPNKIGYVYNKYIKK